MAQGKTIYMDDACKAVNHFSTLGYQCPERTNPADYFMTMMSIEAYEIEDDEDQDVISRRMTEVENDYSKKIDFLCNK